MEKERHVEGHIDAENIAAVLGLPPDHPERRHVESCPRCRSLVDMHRSFLDAAPVEGSGLDEARKALAAHSEREAQRWIPDVGAPARASFWRTLLRPAPLIATALVLVTAAWWFTRTPEESITRGNVAPAQAVVLHEAQPGADGIHLSWDPVTGADHYRVRIYGPDLHELYTSPDMTETSLVIPHEALGATRGAIDLTWEVQARHGKDLVAVSGPGSLHTP
jgi:hypothetical protein